VCTENFKAVEDFPASRFDACLFVAYLTHTRPRKWRANSPM
jgi:hypothetical protein